ncbi:unnamed protein product [Lampetra planeri]
MLETPALRPRAPTAALLLTLALTLTLTLSLTLAAILAGELRSLRLELGALRAQVGGLGDRMGGPSSGAWGGARGQGVTDDARAATGPVARSGWVPVRSRRSPTGEGKRSKKSEFTYKTQSYIHLKPGPNLDSKDDETRIQWELGLKKGDALSLRENAIHVHERGSYFIYSQVLFSDPTFVMGHIVRRGAHSKVALFRCMQNMPEKEPNNSCYTAGMAELNKGDVVELVIPREDSALSLEADSTFIGVMKLM